MSGNFMRMTPAWRAGQSCGWRSCGERRINAEGIWMASGLLLRKDKHWRAMSRCGRRSYGNCE